MRRLMVIFALLVVGAFLGRASAPPARAASQQGTLPTMFFEVDRQPDNQNGLAWIDTRSTAQDVSTLANVLNLKRFFLSGGQPNVPVSCVFSDPGSSCNLVLFAIGRKTTGELFIKDRSNVITITGPSSLFGGSYRAASYTFDSFAGTELRIAMVSAISTGTVCVYAGSFGE